MAIPERYKVKDSWPHLFVRTTETRELPPMPPGTGLPRMTHATRTYCRECYKEWWAGLEPRPMENCPARNDKKEHRRLLG